MKVSQTMARKCMPKCWATDDWSGTCGICSDPHVRYTTAMPSQHFLEGLVQHLPTVCLASTAAWRLCSGICVLAFAAPMAGFKDRTFPCASGYGSPLNGFRCHDVASSILGVRMERGQSFPSQGTTSVVADYPSVSNNAKRHPIGPMMQLLNS